MIYLKLFLKYFLAKSYLNNNLNKTEQENISLGGSPLWFWSPLKISPVKLVERKFLQLKLFLSS